MKKIISSLIISSLFVTINSFAEERLPDNQNNSKLSNLTKKPSTQENKSASPEPQTEDMKDDPANYNKVISGSALYNSNETNTNLNEKQSYSYNLGFQEGYELGKKIAEEEMIAKLNSMEEYLDRIFNFQRLYIEDKIEPPKVIIRKTPVELNENGKLLIIEQEQIEIIEPARLISTPKTWRNFLIEK